MAAEQQGINLAALSLEQLAQLKQALESEVEALTSSYMQLRVAFNRYNSSHQTIKRFTEQNPNQEMLVPLTNSLYVPGSIDNVETLLVDVGTGYFIEKSGGQTQDFLVRKLDLVKSKLAEMEVAMNSKRQNVEQVVMVINQKVQMQQQQGQQEQEQAKAGLSETPDEL